MRRTIFIAVALALTALSACSLYFSDEAKLKQQTPDAGIYPSDASGWGDAGLGDGGCCNQSDAGFPSDGGSGCGDGGISGDAGWPSDGGFFGDAGWPSDGGSDGGYWPDAATLDSY